MEHKLAGSGEIWCTRNDTNAKYFRDGESQLILNELIRRQRRFTLNRIFMSTLNNMCKKVKDMQNTITEAEQLHKMHREKRIKDAYKKHKIMLKKI